MDDAVARIIDELTAEGERFDSTQADRLNRWRVLEPEAGKLVWFLVHVLAARDIVEIGTSHGVSTLWLAEAARSTGGTLLSVDLDAQAQDQARRSVAQAGLAEVVSFQVADGGAVLAALPDASVDVLFLDAERTEYPSWWPHPVRVLRPGGLLIADNALSHPAEIAPLRDLLEQDPRMVDTTLDIGKGELLALRTRAHRAP